MERREENIYKEVLLTVPSELFIMQLKKYKKPGAFAERRFDLDRLTGPNGGREMYLFINQTVKSLIFF